MTNIPRRLLGAILLTLALPGCVGGLLGGGKPDRLYRFGMTGPIAPASGPEALTRRTLVLPPPVFPSEVAGPRLLTMEGGQASYIKDVRWVAAAPLLFGAAVKAGFAARAPWIEVVDRGRADADVLQVSVSRFEADYPGDGSPPTVRVEGEAVLVDGGTGRRLAAYRLVEAEPAAADRAEAIVSAFDTAVARAVSGTVDWAARTRSGRPDPEDPAPNSRRDGRQ